jgi:methyl-accepting chemotaxis protein
MRILEVFVSFISNLSVRIKFIILTTTAVAGILGLCLGSYKTLTTVAVNGPIYKDVVRDKDLIADILPPPEYVIEAYLVSLQIERETDPAKAAALIARCDQLGKDFYSRHDYWRDNLPEGEIRQSLLETSYKPAAEFFRLRDERFLPAVKSGDHAAAANAIAGMTEAYEQHRHAIDDLVKLATADAAKVETAAAESINASLLTLLLVAGGVLTVVTLTSIFTARSITSPINQLLSAVQHLERGDFTNPINLNRGDELGLLAAAMNKSTQSLRTTFKAVADASNTVASAAAEIASNNEQIAERLARQEETANSVGASVNEMAESVVEVARKGAAAATAAEESGCEATRGGEVVRETTQQMQGVAEQVAHSVDAVESLGRKSEAIGKIIAVINEIADQTNLLALNAAIEAARAGEHGRGFAVVADEVRKLAERTTNATDEVANSIREVQGETTRAVTNIQSGTARVKSGVELAGKAGDALHRIIEASASVKSMVHSIAAAAEEQSAASTNILRDLDQMRALTSESTRGAAEAATAAAHLSHEAHNLISLVGAFNV